MQKTLSQTLQVFSLLLAKHGLYLITKAKHSSTSREQDERPVWLTLLLVAEVYSSS